MRETPATIAAAFPWIEQTRALVGSPSWAAWPKELSPATEDLAKLIDRATELLPQTDLASKCLRDVVLPAGDEVINDEFATGSENYKEFFYALVGIAGEGQNTDGNGMYVRFQTGGGSQTVSLGSKTAEHRPAVRQQRRRAARQPSGATRASAARYKPNEPCYQQKIPDVNGPAAAKSLPTGVAADTAQVKSARDKLRREADLSAVRRKLHPFGTQEARHAAAAQEKAK